MMHPYLLRWWSDDATDPGRANLDQPKVQRLIASIASGSQATDLGGVMSLNVRLAPVGWVLRVHQPFVTRARLVALQNVRRRLARQGLLVPLSVPWRNQTVFRCGNSWAELEEYSPHERLESAPDSYVWLFRVLGTLHRSLAAINLAVPRPMVATYAPPGSLRRWLPVTEAAVRDDPEATEIVHLVHNLVNHLRRQWVPASELPTQLIHGDVRLSNVCQNPIGTTVYLDFGFAAIRPRIHDIAYALAFMVLALNRGHPAESFDWHSIIHLIEAYELASGCLLTRVERQALVHYIAAVPLYAATLDGFTEDLVGKLRGRLPFLRLSEWLLTRPAALFTELQ